MPAIRRQEIRPDGFLLDTVEFGTLELSASVSGNQYTFIVRKNGVITHQTTLQNPSIATIEAFVQSAIDANAQVAVKGGTVLGLRFAWHIVSRDPLQIMIRTANTPIPANWWQTV